jgi:hypothetical protein
MNANAPHMTAKAHIVAMGHASVMKPGAIARTPLKAIHPHSLQNWLAHLGAAVVSMAAPFDTENTMHVRFGSIYS